MNEPNGNRLSRRDFFQLAFGWCTAVFAFGASMAAAARYIVPNVLFEPDQRYKALKPEDYAEGVTFLPELRVYLVRKGNSFRAVSAICTHLGCTVNQKSSGPGFHCPCHGSQFNDNGAVTGGPVPKPLPWFLVSLSRDGRIVIDTSETVQADKYLVV